jgi:hypothetical protein
MALTKRRGIIDCQKRQIHFVGPGDYDLEKTLPPGTESFQCETSPSGHMVLPCSEFNKADEAEKHGKLEVGEDLALPVTTSSSSTAK